MSAAQLRLFDAKGQEVDAGLVVLKLAGGTIGERARSSGHLPGDPVYLLVECATDQLSAKRVDGAVVLFERYKPVRAVEVDDSWGAARLEQLLAHNDAELDDAMRRAAEDRGVTPIMPGEYDDQPDDPDPEGPAE